MAVQARNTRVRRHRGLFAVPVAILLTAAACCWAAEPIEVEIVVSPNVLNLQNKGQVVTVHTDIAYSSVTASTVYLNGVLIDHWKADNRGNFVAKFLMSEILELPLNVGELNTLTLIGETVAGESFTGSDEILVVNNVPKK